MGLHEINSDVILNALMFSMYSVIKSQNTSGK